MKDEENAESVGEDRNTVTVRRGVKLDQGAQTDAAEDGEDEAAAAGGAGDGDDLPRSGLR